MILSQKSPAKRVPARREKGKSQKFKLKVKSFNLLLALFTLYILHFTLNSFAQEVTLIYTGLTHAMLYPCRCPKEKDGGLTRRATLIKELKKKYPQALILDSGDFFAGGLMDEYTQGTDLDMQRTLVNLRAMEIMGYAAATIGDDEFNFGHSFLQGAIAKTKMDFLSCNIEAKEAQPFIIKEVSGIKIGIIGVTNLTAHDKAREIKFIEPSLAVKKAVEELKKQGVNIIVLLSHLAEGEDINLINEIKDIDIVITGHSRNKEEPFSKIGDTLILRPSWQARKLGVATFTIEGARISSPAVDELRLSDKVADDRAILSILPKCFADRDCQREGLKGSCKNAGTINSRCIFEKALNIELLVIRPVASRTPINIEAVVNLFKMQFPGLKTTILDYPAAKKAVRLTKELGVLGLPVYLLNKEIEKEANFNNLKERLERKGNFYMLKPYFSGLSYFLNRRKIKGKLDLFLGLYDKNTKELLQAVKEFNPSLHFLAVEEGTRFDAAYGEPEIEEYKRALCIRRDYPEEFWSYLNCRLENIKSSWWDDCAVNLDRDKIKACAKGTEGNLLLRENIALNKELQIMFGPTYLLDNQEVFSSKGPPRKDELREVIKN